MKIHKKKPGWLGRVECDGLWAGCWGVGERGVGVMGIFVFLKYITR